jgi:hypothetical protein
MKARLWVEVFIDLAFTVVTVRGPGVIDLMGTFGLSEETLRKAANACSFAFWRDIWPFRA